jgi:hypothetical protein
MVKKEKKEKKTKIAKKDKKSRKSRVKKVKEEVKQSTPPIKTNYMIRGDIPREIPQPRIIPVYINNPSPVFNPYQQIQPQAQPKRQAQPTNNLERKEKKEIETQTEFLEEVPEEEEPAPSMLSNIAGYLPSLPSIFSSTPKETLVSRPTEKAEFQFETPPSQGEIMMIPSKPVTINEPAPKLEFKFEPTERTGEMLLDIEEKREEMKKKKPTGILGSIYKAMEQAVEPEEDEFFEMEQAPEEVIVEEAPEEAPAPVLRFEPVEPQGEIMLIPPQPKKEEGLRAEVKPTEFQFEAIPLLGLRPQIRQSEDAVGGYRGADAPLAQEENEAYIRRYTELMGKQAEVAKKMEEPEIPLSVGGYRGAEAPLEEPIYSLEEFPKPKREVFQEGRAEELQPTKPSVEEVALSKRRGRPPIEEQEVYELEIDPELNQLQTRIRQRDYNENMTLTQKDLEKKISEIKDRLRLERKTPPKYLKSTTSVPGERKNKKELMEVLDRFVVEQLKEQMTTPSEVSIGGESVSEV